MPHRMPQVLIINDQPENIEVLGETLAHICEVGFALSGPEGLAQVAAQLPDLILLDVMMPGMDGFEVGRILRDDPQLSAIPVVMLTALDGQSDREVGLGTGVKAYLNKPFSPVDLLRLIQQLLTSTPEENSAPAQNATQQQHSHRPAY